jgi:hypothetical protein
MSKPSCSNVYMSRQGEMITPLDTGLKAVSVSAYNGVVMIHIRRYFGEIDKKFPTRYGITLSRREYEDLVSMKKDLLAEYDRVEATLQKKPDNQMTQLRRWPTSDDLNWCYSESYFPDAVSDNAVADPLISENQDALLLSPEAPRQKRKYTRRLKCL